MSFDLVDDFRIDFCCFEARCLSQFSAVHLQFSIANQIDRHATLTRVDCAFIIFITATHERCDDANDAQNKLIIHLPSTSGFTGQKVVQEIVQSGFSGTFALAGRNLEFLEATAATAGCPDAPIILADIREPSSLAAMAASAGVVINLVGPFRFFGPPVVQACCDAGTDCLDISGEPEYIERVEFEYGERATTAGCYIASAVGFDSVPGDVGALWTASQFNSHPPARCTAIETFITIHGGASGFQGHFPTYESAVHGFASARDLASLRKRAAAARPTKTNDVNIPGPKLKMDSKPGFEPRVNAWKLPFMGSDASVVRRTNTALAAAGKPAFHCAVYMTLPSRFSLFLFTLFGGIFSVLARYRWGRAVLLRFPRLFTFGMFSHEGPSEQQMAQTTFEMMNFAAGYSQGRPLSTTPEQPPDMKITTRVAGPEPGYIACSIFIVAAAVTLVEEREKLGVPPGVHTPAFLLQNTTYVDRLKARGITFEVL